MSKDTWRTILALGVTQMIGWGTTYYLLSLMVEEVGRALNLSSAGVLGGVSLTLVAAALFGPKVGRWQDRAGSRIVMVTGSLITAFGLALLSQAKLIPVYYLAWIAIGLGAPMALYSAAFTALTQKTGEKARSAISYVTFFGGLASTLFWPLTAWLMQHFDWRAITLIYAGLNLLICVPLHLLFLDNNTRIDSQASGLPVPEASLPSAAQIPAFLLLAGMLALNGLVFNSFSLLIFPVLEGIGFLPKIAILVASLVGVFQVLGRMGEMLFGDRYPVMMTALVSALCLPLAFGLLIFSSGHLALGGIFAALYGISNGLLTIARGALTLNLFGARGYGERINRITVGQNIAGAIAPILGGLILDKLGASALVTGMFITASLALLCMLALRHHCRKSVRDFAKTTSDKT
jgi:MFS family permease